MGGKPKVADTAIFLLLHQVLVNPIRLIQIRVNIHFTDIMEQVKIKIGNLAFLQLFLKNLFYLRHIGKVVPRKFCGKVKAFPGMPAEGFPHRTLRVPTVVAPCSVVIIHALPHGIIHHLSCSSFVNPAVVPVKDWKAHSAHPKG